MTAQVGSYLLTVRWSGISHPSHASQRALTRTVTGWQSSGREIKVQRTTSQDSGCQGPNFGLSKLS